MRNGQKWLENKQMLTTNHIYLYKSLRAILNSFCRLDLFLERDARTESKKKTPNPGLYLPREWAQPRQAQRHTQMLRAVQLRGLR